MVCVHSTPFLSFMLIRSQLLTMIQQMKVDRAVCHVMLFVSHGVKWMNVSHSSVVSR